MTAEGLGSGAMTPIEGVRGGYSADSNVFHDPVENGSCKALWKALRAGSWVRFDNLSYSEEHTSIYLCNSNRHRISSCPPYRAECHGSNVVVSAFHTSNGQQSSVGWHFPSQHHGIWDKKILSSISYMLLR
mmetsp:Transcript_31232/g.65160  ORF Transcript_31232/g.65160 Transcript_31232/m.65160 type:complete len:131 (+) Transcript_31232:99-491(+)